MFPYPLHWPIYNLVAQISFSKFKKGRHQSPLPHYSFRCALMPVNGLSFSIKNLLCTQTLKTRVLCFFFVVKRSATERMRQIVARTPHSAVCMTSAVRRTSGKKTFKDFTLQSTTSVITGKVLTYQQNLNTNKWSFLALVYYFFLHIYIVTSIVQPFCGYTVK